MIGWLRRRRAPALPSHTLATLDGRLRVVEASARLVASVPGQLRRAEHLLESFSSAQALARVFAREARMMAEWYRGHGRVLVEAKRALGESDAAARMAELGDIWTRLADAMSALAGDREAMTRVLEIAGERTPTERPSVVGVEPVVRLTPMPPQSTRVRVDSVSDTIPPPGREPGSKPPPRGGR